MFSSVNDAKHRFPLRLACSQTAGMLAMTRERGGTRQPARRVGRAKREWRAVTPYGSGQVRTAGGPARRSVPLAHARKDRYRPDAVVPEFQAVDLVSRMTATFRVKRSSLTPVPLG